MRAETAGIMPSQHLRYESIAPVLIVERVERVVVFDVEATSWNCQQHIAPRWDSEEVGEMLRPLRERIAQLEAQLSESAAAGAAGNGGRGG